MGYVDIHCHVLPGVDDGSPNMDITMEMLRIAEENGISDMIVTPHYKQGRVGTPREVIGKMIRDVEKYAKLSGIHVKLHPGTEIYYNSSLGEKLESGWLATMNDTDYVLVEFGPMETFPYVRNAMEDLFSLGYKPILAHVERFECMLADADHVKQLHDMGCMIQTNASSVAGDYGLKVKWFLKKLLKRHLVDFVGTDSHDLTRRKPEMKKCAETIRKVCEPEYADALLYGNAKKFLLK